MEQIRDIAWYKSQSNQIKECIGLLETEHLISQNRVMYLLRGLMMQIVKWRNPVIDYPYAKALITFDYDEILIYVETEGRISLEARSGKKGFFSIEDLTNILTNY